MEFRPEVLVPFSSSLKRLCFFLNTDIDDAGWIAPASISASFELICRRGLDDKQVLVLG